MGYRYGQWGLDVVTDYKAIRTASGLYAPKANSRCTKIYSRGKFKFLRQAFSIQLRRKLWLWFKDLCADRGPSKTRRAGKLSGGEWSQKAGNFCCGPDYRRFVLFLDEPTRCGIQFFPKGNSGIMPLSAESTRNYDFGFDSLYGWGRNFVSELPWSKEENHVHRTPEAHYKCFRSRFFAVKSSKMSVAARQTYGSRFWPKSWLCFWGVSSPHIQRNSPVNQQLLLKALKMLASILPWKLRKMHANHWRLFYQLMSHWYEKCSHQNG